MLSEVRFRNFKSFDDAKLSIGPLTVIIGSNASGKSNVRDGFRFLHGLGRGYSLPEIIGGKYGAGGQVEWTAIRGFGTEIIKFGHDTFSLRVQAKVSNRTFFYNIGIRRTDAEQSSFRVISENLSTWAGPIFTTHPGGSDPIHFQEEDEDELRIRMAKTGEQRKYGNPVSVRPEKPAISQLAFKKNVVRAHKEAAAAFLAELAEMRFLDLVPDLMRQPAFPGQLILGDNGQNLPTVLQDICLTPRRKEILIDWVRELTPMDVTDFEFPINQQTGLVQLSLRTGDGSLVSSYSASDGTLRFLAMLAALLSERSAGLYFFEEIDNGIHPARLKLLVDFLESQTQKQRLQVVTTTHSPDLLSMIGEDTFSNTSVIFNDGSGAGSSIKRVQEFPEISRLRREQGLGKLHASGWMEDAWSFAMTKDAAE
jgi:predicted ATPase